MNRLRGPVGGGVNHTTGSATSSYYPWVKKSVWGGNWPIKEARLINHGSAWLFCFFFLFIDEIYFPMKKFHVCAVYKAKGEVSEVITV